MTKMKNLASLLVLLSFFVLCISSITVVQASVDYQYLLSAPNTATTDPPSMPVLVTVTASSQYSGREGYRACNNSGMTGTQHPQDKHNNAAGDMWMSAANPTSPTLTIDLGEVYPLGKMLIWNFNQASYTNRGVRNCYIQYSSDNTNWTTLGGGLKELAQASANPSPATNLTGGAPVDFLGAPARYVRFRITSNWGDTGKYYGLSEVRIYRYAKNVAASGNFISAKALERSSAYSNVSAAERSASNLSMSDAGTGNYTNSATVGTGVRWMTAVNDPTPYILYDLGGTYPLDKMYVWNYNTSGYSGRGIKNATIYYSIANPGYPDNPYWWAN